MQRGARIYKTLIQCEAWEFQYRRRARDFEIPLPINPTVMNYWGESTICSFSALTAITQMEPSHKIFSAQTEWE